MNFPNILFFYKINSLYSDIRFSFLCNCYFKLHYVLFTNLYIRIYRYKLTKLQKKNIKMNIKEKYQKIDRDLFSDKIKKKKRIFTKRTMNIGSTESKKKDFSYSFSLFNNLNEENVVFDNKKEYNKHQQHQRPKKKKKIRIY